MLFRCGSIQDSTIDGVGISTNIFFQGCNKKCNFCSNPSLQNHNDGYLIDTDMLLCSIHRYPNFYQSIVFVGGEPCLQPEGLYAIASKSNLINVLYTGFLYKEVPENIRSVIHIIVDGEYMNTLDNKNEFPASANQTININSKITTKEMIKSFAKQKPNKIRKDSIVIRR